MENYKLCPNGHYYNSELAECPYCPKPQNTMAGSIDDKTIVHNPVDSGANDKTQIINPPAGNGGGISDATRIMPPQEQPKAQAPAEPAKNHRKLVGWLVSYTIDENGVDYKLFEGRNSIGADAGSDIVLGNDALVSSRHLTILFRLGTFKYKDELSTNGTFINGQLADEGNLNDGDMLKIGSTEFRFRSAL